MGNVTVSLLGDMTTPCHILCIYKPNMDIVFMSRNGLQLMVTVVKLPECEIYSYNPDSEGDPLLEKGAIWSFNFFFYNRKLKRVIGFRCCCLSNLVVDGFLVDEHNDDDTEGEIFDDMDM
ncbi:hypothetical protein ACLOJK_023031 [Asimina triloba]